MDSKELSIDKYSQRKSYSKGKTKKGSRPISPWWYLIGKVEKNALNKASENCKEDFKLQDFKPIKIKIKHKRGGRC